MGNIPHLLTVGTGMEMRADAARNRAAIVDAARVVFAEHGLEAPLDEIARCARVGNATLYRRFPTRIDLIEAVFAEQMREHLDAVEAALADTDPWHGFVTYVHAATAMQARDLGIAALVTMEVPTAPEIDRLRTEAFNGLVQLIEHAQRTGDLRADFASQDVVLILMANAGLVERSRNIAEAASARLVHLLLDGLRGDAATAAPPAPSSRRIQLAMRHNGQRQLGTSQRATRNSPTPREPSR